ncbi:hypothetical protein PMI42_03819 [Bradyrhizobium sp. YR681]|uniref:DUF6418 domain-containing protein n=1 Tax=Bradyrhizobium sp. YR681 TaxID=1144344 RepID=UPI000271322F|nr:DUF6418 domain-containing protein [Bradyrhizobium sp. YR681]EJN12813.1 hypothetical protein PMI42_03819 [Bradyrhizobium sp. YR681]
MSVSWWSFETLLPALLDIVAIGFILAVMAWIAVSRPGLVMIAFLVLFAFVWRLISVFYIDAFGPVFSEQLERYVGPGLAALPFVASQALVIAALLVSFRPQRLRALASGTRGGLAAMLPPGRFDLSNIAFWTVLAYVLGLWIELRLRGPIPLFAGIERFDYTRQYGGPLHQRLIEWGAMLAFQLGLFMTMPAMRGRGFDLRFAALFGAVLIYLFVVGHRFSSFYAYSSFFIIPVGALLLREGADQRRFPRILRYFALAAAGLVALIVVALIHSYTVVRGSEIDQLRFKLTQRILVQQGEMWWATYERVFVHGDWNGALAMFKLFVAPFNPSSNSTMQFLMEQSLPLDRTYTLLTQGQTYTGGWPEVLFEVGGPVEGFFLVAGSAILFSEFMFLLTRCMIQERYVTCFFLTPILYAVSICVVSGMVNSFIQVTFMVKLAMAVLVYVMEDRWRASRMAVALSPNSTDVAAEVARSHTMNDTSASISSVAYVGGMLANFNQTVRSRLPLLIVGTLVAMLVVFLADRARAPLYVAEATMRLGRLDGADVMQAQSTAIHMGSAAFKRRVEDAMPPSSGDDKGQVLDSLSVRPQTFDLLSLSVYGASEQAANAALQAAVRVLNADQEKIRTPLLAEFNIQMAMVEANIASLMKVRESLASADSISPSASADPASLALRRVWLLDLQARNEEKLAAATNDRRALATRLGPSKSFPAALSDDVTIRQVSPRPVRHAFFAGAIVLLALLLYTMLSRPSLARTR